MNRQLKLWWQRRASQKCARGDHAFIDLYGMGGSLHRAAGCSRCSWQQGCFYPRKGTAHTKLEFQVTVIVTTTRADVPEQQPCRTMKFTDHVAGDALTDKNSSELSRTIMHAAMHAAQATIEEST